MLRDREEVGEGGMRGVRVALHKGGREQVKLR